jgi:hypothetical protein
MYTLNDFLQVFDLSELQTLMVVIDMIGTES